MQAQATPHSRNAKLSCGKRRVTPPRYERLAQHVLLPGLVADVVVGPARDRAAAPRHARPRHAVAGEGDAELDALREDRIVVVLAVRPVAVEPEPVGAVLLDPGEALGQRRDRPPYTEREHRDLEAQHRTACSSSASASSGRFIGITAGTRQAVAVLAVVELRVHLVHGARRDQAVLVVAHVRAQQALARVDHAEVDAELVEPLVHQARELRRDRVLDVGHRPLPPVPAPVAAVAPLLERGRRSSGSSGAPGSARRMQSRRPCAGSRRCSA